MYILMLGIAVIVIIVAGFALTDREKVKLSDALRSARNVSYVTLSKGTTAYRMSKGSLGKTVVFAHGATIPSWSWDLLAKEMEDAGYGILTYDMYGRGLSDNPEVSYDRKLYLDQLKELVDALQIEKPFHLVGLSFGGATAVNFASKFPQYVDKLVLIAPVIHNYSKPKFMKVPVVAKIAIRLFGVSTISKRFNSFIRNFQEYASYATLFDEQTRYKGFRRSMFSMLSSDAIGIYDDAYKTVGAQQRKSLLIWGMQDEEITEDMITAVRSLIPSIEFLPLDGAGHGVLFEKHKEVSEKIISFFSS